MRMECRAALPLIVPAMAGWMLAKRTRAGANGGSAFCKEPGEETPTFLGTVRRMTLGPRRDGGERPEQYMIMQLELAPAQPGTA
jgi:hypothetical protein